ncbi:hypothetical protein ACJMK2_032953, partial [Sinanodonta woodiana]
SDMQMKDESTAEVRIPDGHACAPKFVQGMQYVIMANHITPNLEEIQLCERSEESGTYC